MSSPPNNSEFADLLAVGRFVWLFHELPAHAARASHWDLMLETPDSLRTWAFSCDLPNEATGDASIVGAAVALPNHRTAYLVYEGPVSGDRGTVRRLDAGEYTARRITPGNTWCIELNGERLRGRLAIDDPDSTNECRWRWSPRLSRDSNE